MIPPPPPPPLLLSIVDRSNVATGSPRRGRVDPAQPTMSALSIGAFYSRLIAQLSLPPSNLARFPVES